MFRDRPLTWLFVIATICVDLALVVARSNGKEYGLIVGGYVLGQVAALTIWTVRGSVHRLLRASVLVFASGALSHFVILQEGILTFIFIFSITIFAVTLLVEAKRYFSRYDASDIKQRKRLQVPLIEFFGWTIVVAIISFGCRYMDFKELFNVNAIEIVLAFLAMLAVPFLLVLFVHDDLRDLRSIKSLILVVAAIAAEGSYGYFIIASQAAYLIAWMTVLTLDNISAEAAKTRSSPEETPPATTEPKLFNPQD